MFTYRQLLKLGILAITICVVALKLSDISHALGLVWDAIFPLFLGGIFAFVLNIGMQFFERLYFPTVLEGWKSSSRSYMSLILSMISLLVVVFFVGNMAIPQLVNSLGIIVKAMPILYQQSMAFIYEWGLAHPTIAAQVQSNVSWEQIANTATTWSASSGEYVLRGMTNLLSLMADVVLAFIFAVYILLNKKELSIQSNRLLEVFMPEKYIERFYYVIHVMNSTFKSFIVGQVWDAIILGLMVGIGLWIMGVSYALTIGCVVGLTALIPLIGGAIGAFMGLIMLLTVSPVEAGIYMIVFIVMQQIEGNIIYPRIVGNSVGLPGIWVFASITVGGSLYGVPGILLSVPIMATIYKLGKDYIEYRLEK